MTPMDIMQQAQTQAEDLVNGLPEHWPNLPAGVRRIIMATVSNPASRSDALLQLAAVLDEFAGSLTSPNQGVRNLAEALCAYAAALTNLAPTRA